MIIIVFVKKLKTTELYNLLAAIIYSHITHTALIKHIATVESSRLIYKMSY